MKKNKLAELSMEFSVDIIDLVKYLKFIKEIRDIIQLGKLEFV